MELEHLLTKAACEETVLAFFHALDTRRHEAAAALMTEDGCWERQDGCCPAASRSWMRSMAARRIAPPAMS